MGFISETIRNIKYPNRTGIPLPPRKEIMWSGHGHFIKVGMKVLELLEEYGLSPTDSVLDLGCGNGRTAFPLTQYLKNDYLGLDISKHQIDWCTRNITPKYPDFQFRHLNVFNAFYNPKGEKLTEDFRLPASNNSYDYIILTSVFTHMLPGDIEIYMKEIARVLKPKGKVFITYFLLNMTVTDKAVFSFPYKVNSYCSVEDQKMPESVVGYDPFYIHNLYAKNKLPITAQLLGHWRTGNEKSSKSFQDIIVATKS